MAATNFKEGETVVHTGKPEWGPGDILKAEATTHEGQPCQRLTIRFSRAGLKTISTAFATLRTADARSKLMAEVAAPYAESAQVASTDREAALKALVAVPEGVTDAFIPAPKRLGTLLGLYVTWDKPSGIIDWATAQTSLRDPLAMFTRHELEQALEKYRVALDNSLKKLVPAALREDAVASQTALRAAGPSARAALRRADVLR